jgi:hypothetical protein
LVIKPGSDKCIARRVAVGRLDFEERDLEIESGVCATGEAGVEVGEGLRVVLVMAGVTIAVCSPAAEAGSRDVRGDVAVELHRLHAIKIPPKFRLRDAATEVAFDHGSHPGVDHACKGFVEDGVGGGAKLPGALPVRTPEDIH